jgi:hypothetical protein
MRGEITTDDMGRPILRYDTPCLDTCGIGETIMAIHGIGIAKVLSVADYMMHVDVRFVDFKVTSDELAGLDKRIAKILDDLAIEQANAEIFSALKELSKYSHYKSRLLRINTRWIRVLTYRDRVDFINTCGAINAVYEVKLHSGDKKYDVNLRLRDSLSPDQVERARKTVFSLLRTIVMKRLREDLASS